MDTKVCTKCDIEKPLDQFYKDKSTKTWYASRCKSCKDKHTRDYYDRNKDRINKQKRDSWYNKTDRKKANDKKRREDNREKKLESDRRYREENRELIRERDKQYRLNNPEKYKERSRRQREIHWQEWIHLHYKTFYYIKDNNLRPDTCSICNKKCIPDSHHPDRHKWNEVVFVCRICHTNIHAWNIECPKPINLLDLVPPFNSNNNSEKWE